MSPSIISAYFTRIQIAVQLREHAQIPTRPVRLLAAIRANSLTLRQSVRWQQLAQSSWRNQSWVLRISTAVGCTENRYIRCNDSTRLPCATIAPDDLTVIILFISSLRIYARNLMMERTILVLHENVSRETSVKAIRVIINITVWFLQIKEYKTVSVWWIMKIYELYCISWTAAVIIYIRCEMTPTSAGGEQQNYISGGIQSPIWYSLRQDCRDARHALHDVHLAARMSRAFLNL